MPVDASPSGAQGAGAATTAAPAVVRASNLHVAWDMDLVLHGVDFAIPAGQAVALTGANGSGKSTTLRALLGTAPITRGGVELFGASVARPSAVDWKRVGYVPQRVSSGGGVSASAIEVVRSGLLGPRRWWAAPGDSRAAMGALERVGLAHRASSPMGILSGGQQQRVLIARALVRRPDLLVMDEPMAGIDAASRARLAELVAEAKQEGTTVLVVLHELGELGPLLDRELHVAGGHISYDGPPHLDGADEGRHGNCHAPLPRPSSPGSVVDDIVGGGR